MACFVFSFLLQENTNLGADNGLLGQLGFGFYSAFLVAEKVVVSTKSPKSDKQYNWESVADSSYINLPHPAEMEDDEIADVDINDDESYKGLNTAEALRAHVNAEAREEDPMNLSSSNGRESSESRAESSSSGSSSSGKTRNNGSESGTASQ